MNQMLILWLSAGVFFFIIEMFTGTLYGLSLSLAGFLLAGYVWFTGENSFTLIQAIVLALSSGIFSYFFPKWFAEKDSKNAAYSNNPLEREIGKTFVLVETKGVYKISIDGVDYRVADDSVTKHFAGGKKVLLDESSGSMVKVTLLSM